ncbi:hypothetical protein [Alienimonas chondri]|uniref:Nucleotidyltransferase family protein n=1 Tax=Alienimonas chondri TaxID=2681879 RepID=A0ABX1VDB3_9PLAN|nr:hypothetical protein [Alienimonas chondri]NNJ25882.1 hypothetical protein [Alienimonas chondri]
MANAPFPSDFQEFLSACNAAGVEYLLIGGYAVTYHGYPRYTADMDVWVRSDPANAARVVDALDRFGFADAGATADMFLKPDQIVCLGVEPLRLELFTTIPGVEFEDCWASRVVQEYDDLSVPIISRDDLLKNKAASGRPKDLIDVEALE